MSQTAQKAAPGLRHAPVHPILASTDVARSRDFFVNTLGLHEAAYTEGSQAQIEAGDGTMIYLYQRPGVRPAESTVAGFVVEDLDKAMTDLRSRGVRFEEYDLPGLKTVQGVARVRNERVAWFKDPDGHILAIAER